jgi:hypothetical protein
MRDLVAFLQRHHNFPDGARLHPVDRPPTAIPSKRKPPEATMLDDQSIAPPPIGLVEVADYIELGRLVADWAASEEARPSTVDELARQLDGIARVPPAVKEVRFVQGDADVLVIRLPVRNLMEKRLRELESPLVGERYQLPKFYDDIYHRHFGPEMTPLDTFLARMGDYTIAQCQ